MSTSPTNAPVRLRLKKREERRLLAGHLWVFSNEIDTTVTPLKDLEPGVAAIVENANGKFLAHAYVNPASLISVRVTSTNKARPFNATMLRSRLEAALQQRSAHFSEPFYRWINGEGDFLPGLVVDRYNDVLVVQITTAGMEHYREQIADALISLSGASALCLRCDNAIRELEGLPLYREWVSGTAPDTLQVQENGINFQVSAELGQKTGWFYDHRESRMALRSWVEGKRVLDLYSYVGGFGLNAVAGKAASVVSVDASQSAIDAAFSNAKLNGLDSNYTAMAADAVEAMRSMFTEGDRFDVIALDPPAFIKRKKDRDAGLRHYTLNNRLAMKLLNPGGVLLSASCSQALDMHSLQQCVRQGLPASATGIQVLQTFQQAPDHPVNIAMPETLYLKGLIARVC